MKLSELIQKMMKDFLIIFASIIIVITILRQVYYPDMAFDLKSIYIVMAFSIFSALIGFVLYSPHDSSEKEMRIRMFIHFASLEILLIFLGILFDIVNSISDVAILALEIALIYSLVRLLSWQNDKKDAQKINEKLKAFKKDVY